MIIIAGHLRVAADEREAYLSAVADVAVRARRLPGCHDFVQAPDPIDPERIVVFERWVDDEAVLAFRSLDDDEEEDTVAAPDILEADVSTYRIASVESP